MRVDGVVGLMLENSCRVIMRRYIFGYSKDLDTWTTASSPPTRCEAHSIHRTNMLIEDQRFIHEDLERLEQAITDRTLDDAKNVSFNL